MITRIGVTIFRPRLMTIGLTNPAAFLGGGISKGIKRRYAAAPAASPGLIPGGDRLQDWHPAGAACRQ